MTTKNPADGVFVKVGPADAGKKPSAKPADNQPKIKPAK
jgi:hypothetical protein